jgi:sec-independent protein translocase protein TatC
MDNEQLEGQTILEHLEELSVYVRRIIIGIIITTFIGFFLGDKFLAFIASNFRGATLTLSPFEVPSLHFKTALFIGFAIAIPWTLLQFWRWVSPGLTKSERRYVFVFVPSGTLLFLLGITFAWYILLPIMFFFSVDLLVTPFELEMDTQEYVRFALGLLFWTGISFQIPLVIYVISRLGYIESQMLRNYWKPIVVVIIIFAATFTPSDDPPTMLLISIYLILVVGFSVLLTKIGERQFRKTLLQKKEPITE